MTGEPVMTPDYGEQICATTAVPLVPRGEAIRHWLATNREIEGVGPKTAQKLWDQFGEGLYDRLRSKDIDALAAVVGPLAAFQAAEAFTRLADEAHALEWFDRLGIEPSVAMLACRLWGGAAIERVTADPYALCVAEPWKRVDERARRLGVGANDDRRLTAAVLEIAARRFTTRGRGIGGHMASTHADLVSGAQALLGCDRVTAQRAFEIAAARGDVREHGADLWQARGPHLMERSIEKAIADRKAQGPRTLPSGLLASAIADIEAECGINLDEVQRAAVEAAVTNRVMIIAGGAGTGKSTITRAVMTIINRMRRPYLQMALSGRAAKRLVEATGRPAMTVHRFLKAARYGKLGARGGLVVIDEASMIGTTDLWQILSWLPADVDLVLVGDPAQLPPISAGNPLVMMINSGKVPMVTLNIIRRQGPGSEVPRVAALIRAGEVPELRAFDPSHPQRDGVSLLACKGADLREATLTAFGALVGPPPRTVTEVALLHEEDVQVLGATLKGPHGTEETATAIERRWMAHRPPVHNWGVAIGSRILWTKNVYERAVGADVGEDKPTIDIMNGAIGTIERMTPTGAVVRFDDADSTRAEVGVGDLFNFKRGWAFSVHKAQGSAFDHVVVPLNKSRLLDRLLLYTAVTRARKSVVLVGDPEVLRWAIERPPAAFERRQTLLLD